MSLSGNNLNQDIYYVGSPDGKGQTFLLSDKIAEIFEKYQNQLTSSYKFIFDFKNKFMSDKEIPEPEYVEYCRILGDALEGFEGLKAGLRTEVIKFFAENVILKQEGKLSAQKVELSIIESETMGKKVAKQMIKGIQGLNYVISNFANPHDIVALHNQIITHQQDSSVNQSAAKEAIVKNLIDESFKKMHENNKFFGIFCKPDDWSNGFIYDYVNIDKQHKQACTLTNTALVNGIKSLDKNIIKTAVDLSYKAKEIVKGAVLDTETQFTGYKGDFRYFFLVAKEKLIHLFSIDPAKAPKGITPPPNSH